MSKKVNTEPAATEVISMHAAAEEFGKRLVKLYSAEYFVREGKMLREHLVEMGVEAGASLESIASLSDKNAKVEQANKAISLFNSVAYTANVMLMTGLYTKKQAAPLIGYAQCLVNALSELVAAVPETHRVIKVKSPISVLNSDEEQVDFSFPSYISAPETYAEYVSGEEVDGLNDAV